MNKAEIITTTVLTLTLVGTVFGGIIVGAVYVARIEGRIQSLNPEQIKERVHDAEQRIIGVYPDLQERIKKMEQQGQKFAMRLAHLETASAFGPWQSREANLVYRAPSDGFVVGFAHNRGEFSFRIGSTASKSDFVERGRITQYEGMMMPVKCGQHYLVNAGRTASGEGSPRFIDVYWISLGRKNLCAQPVSEENSAP